MALLIGVDRIRWVASGNNEISSLTFIKAYFVTASLGGRREEDSEISLLDIQRERSGKGGGYSSCLTS